MLCGWAGQLSRLPDQVNLQAMPCNWVSPLGGVTAWVRSQAMFGSQKGPLTGLQRCAGSLLKLPGYAGPQALDVGLTPCLNGFISWALCLSRLSGQASWSSRTGGYGQLYPELWICFILCRTGSTAGTAVWPGTQIRQNCRPISLDTWSYQLGRAAS